MKHLPKPFLVASAMLVSPLLQAEESNINAEELPSTVVQSRETPSPRPQNTPTQTRTRTAASAPIPVATPVDSEILFEPVNEEKVTTTSSFYGYDIDWVDVPRSVTVIDPSLLETGAFESVRDFSKFYASGFTKTNFGSPAHPSVRGLPADIFVDGMRQGLRNFGNGMPFSMNAYEGVEVVKGMPPPTFGIQQYISGYLNLQRKMPDFVENSGSIGFTYGSFDKRSYRLEFEDIINPSLAYIFSTEIENSGSYYENGFRDTEAFYLAFSYLPEGSAYSSNLSFDYYNATYTENFGINRPTQTLIDQGLYQTGSVTDANGDGVVDNRDVNGAFNQVNLGPLRGISRSKRLLSPGDRGDGQHLNIHFQQKYDDGGNTTWTNDTTFRWVDRDLLSSYFYSEVIDDSIAFENRLLAVTELPSLFIDDEEASLVYGVGIRYQEVDAINDYFNEPTNAWDLLSPIPIRYVNQIAGGATPVPGRRGFFGFPGTINGETNQSEAVTISPIVQWRTPITDSLTFDIGGRLDILHVDYTDPLIDFEDNYTAYMPSGSASLTYSLNEDWALYANVSFGHSSGIANGGGYGVGPNGFNYDYFHRENLLVEGGLKGQFDDGSRFALAVFSQERTEGLLGILDDTYVTKGVELEFTKQITDKTHVRFNYSYLDSILEDQAPFVITGSPIDQFGADGTPGFITPNFANLPRGDYREPGLPMHSFNFAVTHEVTENFSITPSIQVTGEMNNNYSGSLVIPTQHWVDLTFRYAKGNYSTWLSLINLTDQDNWSPPNPIFGNDSIVAELPFHIQGGVTIEF